MLSTRVLVGLLEVGDGGDGGGGGFEGLFEELAQLIQKDLKATTHSQVVSSPSPMRRFW